MNLFGREPQEQAMQTLIHDTNSALFDFNAQIKELSRWLNENAKLLQEAKIPISSEPYIRIEYLKTCKKELQDALDQYYTKAKNDFKK